MLKKVLTGTGIAAVLAAGFLMSSLTLGPVSAQTPTNPAAETVVQSLNVQGPDTDAIELEEQVGDQSEIDDDTVENQVEQDGEFDGEF